MILGLGLLATGLFFCWLAVIGWRTRSEDRISVLEAAILRVTGAEPLPISRFDRVLHWFQLVMVSIFGPMMALLGIAFLFT